MTTNTTDLLGHFAWCAQIAIGIARRDKMVTTSVQEHIFLMNWLTTAQKKKLFPREIAGEIDVLIRLGKQQGIIAGLKRKLTFIYKSCCEDIGEQSDLFRLTYALEELKNNGRRSHTLSTADWKKGWEGPFSPAIYIELPALQAAFSDEGKQLKPLPVRITGDAEYATQMLSRLLSPSVSVCPANNLLLLTP
ncbi:DUF2913 family protein [Salmonella enterica]|nr:DUF2913 family protein [Salmonella enterica]ECF1924986.1 DUF2913 family protein [Salmonella enterica subsp. enterica serovar Newport]ECQ8979427.1 DUF2913 family protein [Salmonella enterica subsp. enterica]EDU6369223.1 DUF2913 family protein [Salmonella enterica subsp. houtenae serovar 40:z4,z24:-]MCH5494493.1 DUF2913 family protein [Salmonella enterica subsp. diarizonae serovar 16:z10:e,n,x,z15]